LKFVLLVQLASVVFGQSTTGCAVYTASTKTFTGTIRDVWGCHDGNLPNANIQSSGYSVCGEDLRAGEPTPVCANGGTFECAQDFERYNGVDQGIVNINLGSDNSNFGSNWKPKCHEC